MSHKAATWACCARFLWLCLASEILVSAPGVPPDVFVSEPPDDMLAGEAWKAYESDGEECKGEDADKKQCNCSRVISPFRPYYIPDEMVVSQEWVTVGSLSLGKTSGRWYYEFRYGRGAKMTQAGWVSSKFNFTRDFNDDGAGDCTASFSADVERHCKRNGLDKAVLIRWMTGELLGAVLGCAIDIDEGVIWFYLNGRRVANSELFINKDDLPKGTAFFPSASSKGDFTFVFAKQDLLFYKMAEAIDPGLKPLSECSLCQCSWPPKAAKHSCSSEPNDETVNTDGEVISKALQSLAPDRCGSEWDCSKEGVFGMDSTMVQCESAVKTNVFISLTPAIRQGVLQRLRERLEDIDDDEPRFPNLTVDEEKKKLRKTRLQESIYFNVNNHTDLRLFKYLHHFVEISSLQISENKAGVQFDVKVYGVSYAQMRERPSSADNLKEAVRSGIHEHLHDFSDECQKDNIKIEILGGGRVSILSWFQLGLSGQIPKILEGLSHLTGLYLGRNRLTGTIPTELGRLSRMQMIVINNNELQGEIPVQLFNYPKLEVYNLAQNYLSGSLPSEIALLQNCVEIFMQSNRLNGSLPTDIGRLGWTEVIWLMDNKLSGTLPTELGGRGTNFLASIKFSGGHLRGSVPTEISKLTELRVFRLMDNQLTGQIPRLVNDLVLRWEMGSNSFQGTLPLEPEWRRLMVYDFTGNNLQGQIPTMLGKFKRLYFLNVGSNRLEGQLPTEMGELGKLGHLFVLRNSLKGQLPTELGRVALLQNIFAYDNNFVGTLPEGFCNMPNLTTLWMSSNQLSGSIPECYSELVQLKYVLLSRNRLSGKIPSGFNRLDNLNALTLNDNMFSGSLSQQGLQMRSHGVDNKVVLMLQRNELSCELPHVITGANYQAGHVLVVLGNMFDGPQLPPWVRPQEKKSELLYNSRPGLDVMVWMFLCPCAFIGTILLLRMLFGPAIWMIVLDAVMAHSKDSLVNLYRGLLLACALTAIIPSLLLLLYRFGSGYYECGQDLAKTTAAYFKSTPIAQWLVILLWCCWLFAIGSFALIIPHYIPGSWEERNRMPNEKHRLRRAKYIFGHITWLGAMTLISWPSFLYAIAKTLHDDNVIFFGKFKDNARKIVFYLAPLTQAVMDSLVAPNFAGGYARIFGCSPWTLLVLARAITTWAVLLATSLVLVENCVGGWKWFWLVCKAGSTDLDFTLSIPNPLDVTYADTKWRVTITGDDVCAVGSNTRVLWWFYNRCDRSLLESLAPFLGTRMAVAAFGLPSLYLLRFEKLGTDAKYLLRKQCLAITGVLQVGIIFVPFVPVLMPLIVGAISFHLVACHYWVKRHPDVELEDPNPAWMISLSLKPSVTFVSFLMLHYAWVNDFHGKYFLSGFIAVTLPILFFTSRIVFKSRAEEIKRLREAGTSIWVELGARFRKDTSGARSFESQASGRSSVALASVSGSFVVPSSSLESGSARVLEASSSTDDSVESF